MVLIRSVGNTAALLNLYQLDVEVQFLACHFMVSIKGNSRIITGSHLDLHGLTGTVIQHNVLSGAQFLATGQLADLHCEDSAGIGISVRLVRSQMDVDTLTDFHLGNSLIISTDHHTYTADELQRLATVIGRVKDSTVIQRAAIMSLAKLAYIRSFNTGD